MSANLEKVKSIFKSPGIAAVLRWSKCVHIKVVCICLITVAATVASLGFTLATKGLVDGAVSSDYKVLVHYAILLFVIILVQHALSAARAWFRIHASAELQESLQKMLVKEILSKQYGSLKGYHSGELVNRVFSDMGVIKNGIMSILPSLIGIVVSFLGAAGILTGAGSGHCVPRAYEEAPQKDAGGRRHSAFLDPGDICQHPADQIEFV